MSSPQALLELEYRQQGFLGLPVGRVPGINSDELIQLIEDLVNSPISLPLPLNLPLDLQQFKLPAGPAAAGPQGSLTLDGPDVFNQLDDLALDLHLLQPEQAPSKSIDLGSGWKLTFEAADNGSKHYRIQFDATGIDAAVPRGDFGVFVGKQPADVAAILIGDRNGTHFAVKSVRFGLHFRPNGPLFDVQLKLEQIEFVLKPDFLSFLSFGLDIPTALRFESSVDVVYTQGQGLTGQMGAAGSPGLSMQFAPPINLRIGGAGAGLNLDQVVTRVDVSLANGELRFRVLFRYSANAQFGPLGAIMDGAGVRVGR